LCQLPTLWPPHIAIKAFSFLFCNKLTQNVIFLVVWGLNVCWVHPFTSILRLFIWCFFRIHRIQLSDILRDGAFYQSEVDSCLTLAFLRLPLFRNFGEISSSVLQYSC
jgi:hypothetical protein